MHFESLLRCIAKLILCSVDVEAQTNTSSFQYLLRLEQSLNYCRSETKTIFLLLYSYIDNIRVPRVILALLFQHETHFRCLEISYCFV